MIYISLNIKFLIPFFIGFAVITNCCGQKDLDQENIKKSVLTFFEWYIGTTKDSRYSSYVHGIEGENGKTRLEITAYFRSLDSLQIIGNEFIQSELERFRPCDSLLRTVPWTTFSADAYEYDSKCYWLYYYYWTNGQEPHDEAEILDVSVNKKVATATANLYFGDDKSRGDKIKVYLTKTRGRWLITKLEKER